MGGWGTSRKEETSPGNRQGRTGQRAGSEEQDSGDSPSPPGPEVDHMSHLLQ